MAWINSGNRLIEIPVIGKFYLPDYRKTGIRIHISVAMKYGCIYGDTQKRQFVLKRRFIMIISVFSFFNYVGHHAANHRCGFELIPTGSDGLIISF